jgi:hypothetical protein
MFVDDAKLIIEEQNVADVTKPATGYITLFADRFTGHLWQEDDQGVSTDLCFPVNTRYALYQWDCNNIGTAANIGGWQCSAIATGTIANVTTSIASGTPTTTQALNLANHPGVISISSSATANSGAQCTWGGTATGTPLVAGRVSDFILCPINLANATIRMGFSDTANQNDAVDGAYIEVAPGGIASGKSANNSTRSTTATTFTLVANTWYHARISVTSATTALFEIISEAGVVLWSDSVTGNIPTDNGRDCLPRFIVTNSAAAATFLCQLDMASWKGPVARGAIN